MGLSEERRAELARKGAVEMTVADWLGLDDAEMRVIELRISLVKAIRRRREQSGISQATLARRIGTGQPNIAKIEAGGIGVSLDLLMRVFFAAGGRMAELAEAGEAVA